MRDITTLPAGTKLTAEEANALVAASTLTGLDRYGLHQTAEGWKVWDREEGEYVADSDGEKVFTWEDANDLRQEWAWS